MNLTDARKTALMAYCRIDELDAGEAVLLESLYAAAVAYMEQAGVSEPKEGTPRRAQYDLAVNYLVLDSYDQRETVFAGTIVADNPAFRRIMNQLKLTEPEVSDSDTFTPLLHPSVSFNVPSIPIPSLQYDRSVTGWDALYSHSLQRTIFRNLHIIL